MDERDVPAWYDYTCMCISTTACWPIINPLYNHFKQWKIVGVVSDQKDSKLATKFVKLLSNCRCISPLWWLCESACPVNCVCHITARWTGHKAMWLQSDSWVERGNNLGLVWVHLGIHYILKLLLFHSCFLSWCAPGAHKAGGMSMFLLIGIKNQLFYAHIRIRLQGSVYTQKTLVRGEEARYK